MLYTKDCTYRYKVSPSILQCKLYNIIFVFLFYLTSFFSWSFSMERSRTRISQPLSILISFVFSFFIIYVIFFLQNTFFPLLLISFLPHPSLFVVQLQSSPNKLFGGRMREYVLIALYTIRR